jgi:hypothetical protein
MKKSVLIHGVSIAAGVLGAVALASAWVAGDGGTAFGLSQAHLYQDALNLQLIAVSGGVCAITAADWSRKEDEPMANFDASNLDCEYVQCAVCEKAITGSKWYARINNGGRMVALCCPCARRRLKRVRTGIYGGLRRLSL